MTGFCCPVCGGALEREGRSLLCEKRHCFDLARSGYVHLLPAHLARSKEPGDNKQMVRTRTAFLDKGYYAPLREKLAGKAADFLAEDRGTPVLLDAGCGEGYYMAGIAEAVQSAGIEARLLGVDLSKTAVDRAARRVTSALFGVGSIFRLPVQSDFCTVVTEVFAPCCPEEFYRVLKKNGVFLQVIPSEEHLFELKQAVYAHPYKNEVKPYVQEGFRFLGGERIEQKIRLESGEDIRNLFRMTPYSYKTSVEDTARLESLERLETTASFELLAYRVEK